MTTRERRLRKAERLREWAEKRDGKAAAARATGDAISSQIPFGQPILVGHHSEKRHRRDIDRIDSAMRATVENTRTAEDFRSRADNIEAAADNAIYSDDEDAVERLREKLEALEAKRAAMKAANAAFRKEHRAELKGKTAYERSQLVPHPSYQLSNLGGVISNTRKRLAFIESGGAERAAARDRVISARYAGRCADCGAAIERGQTIRYSRANGARCEQCEEA